MYNISNGVLIKNVNAQDDESVQLNEKYSNEELSDNEYYSEVTSDKEKTEDPFFNKEITCM